MASPPPYLLPTPSFQPPPSFQLPPRIPLTETTRNQAVSSPSPPLVHAPPKRAFSSLDDDNDINENDLVRIDKNCDQVRRMINTLIDSGEMKVKDFCDAIEVSSPAYYRFMGQSGPHKGAQSDTYIAALKFFQNRERKHIPMPKKKAKTAAAGVSAGASSAAAVGLPDISDIALEGEMEDAVPVYDTCDEVRRKINAHLKKPGVTQASFLRDLMAQYHTQNRKIAASYLHRFRGAKGPDAGNTNPCFYAGYVFFEKIRIKEGKKKSKDRETMERLYAGRGMDTTRPSGNVYYSMRKGDSLTKDKFGGVSIAGRPPHYR